MTSLSHLWQQFYAHSEEVIMYHCDNYFTGKSVVMFSTIKCKIDFYLIFVSYISANKMGIQTQIIFVTLRGYSSGKVLESILLYHVTVPTCDDEIAFYRATANHRTRRQ